MNARISPFHNSRRWLSALVSALVIVAYLVLPSLSLAATAAMPAEFALNWLHLEGPEEGFGG